MHKLLSDLKDVNFFKRFKEMVFLISMVVFLYALAVPIHGVDNSVLLLLSLGVALCALGSIAMYKMELREYPQFNTVLNVQVPAVTPAGVFFWVVGIVLVLIGVYKLVI